jgi:hypothetical protein
MAFLKVDPEELSGAAATIDNALPVGFEISSGSPLGASAEAAGRRDVSSAIGSFLDAWSYGIGLVNADAQHLAELLRLAGDAYAHAETTIGSAES